MPDRPKGAPLLAALLLSFSFLLPAAPALGDDGRPGNRIEITPADLPPPYAGESVSRPPRVVPRPEGATLQVPSGFAATLFAEGLEHPRWLAVAPDGAVFLADSRAGRVLRLRDKDGDGRAEEQVVFVQGLSLPHGLAVRGDHLYIGDVEAVWRVPLAGPAGEVTPEAVTPPDALGSGGGHWTRTIAFDPAGERLFVAIGSAGNVGEEPEPRATIQVFTLDAEGKAVSQETYAAGLRNPVGLAFRPGSDELWTVVNERDGLGDELVPDYLTRVVGGGFYGWPYAYIGPNPQPGFAERRVDLVEKTLVPDLLFRSHSAPIGLVFYEAGAFPEDYHGDAFVALRGSWNAAVPRGYVVVRVPFAAGRPAGGYEVFAAGFRLSPSGEADRAEVWGRPAGLAVAADGSLLIADDTGGTIWRVAPEALAAE